MASTFQFDGQPIPFQPGDTLASALHRADVLVISRSLKYHRPRGLYCCTGSCASCLVDVDGVPNLPACMQGATAGAVVSSQNRIGSAKRDLLGVVDQVYRRGFDPHGAFTKPRLLNAAFLKAVRFMSGLGKVPRDGSDGTPRRHQVAVDELIIGAGMQGLRRAQDARGNVLVIDELDGAGGSLRWNPGESDTAQMRGVLDGDGPQFWPNALAFGIYDDVVAVRRGEDLVEVRAPRITIAPGRHDDWPLFANNDLPGVLSLRGATRLLGEHGVLPGRSVVVHGSPPPDDFVAELEMAGGRVVAQGPVTAAHGSTSVRAATVDGAKVACDAIVCALPGTPRVELFQQAGCELTFDGSLGGLMPRVDRNGRTTRSDIFAAFSRAVTP